eukprot:6482443-Amphidinium_carterae.1
MGMTDALEVAESAADRILNLKVKYAKCRLQPIGTQRENFAMALSQICDVDHPFRRMQIVDSMRVLGWWLGTGAEHELDACALKNMQHCVPKLYENGLGMITNQFLLERGIFTMAAHVLRSCQASSALRSFVDTHQELLASTPRAWFRPFSQHAKSMFGLPVKYHPAAALQMMLQVKSVHGSENSVCAGYERAVQLFENSGLAVHPLASWQRGHWPHATWLLTRVRIQRNGSAEWQDWERIRSHIKRLHSNHEQVAKDELIARLNFTCSSLPSPLMRALKRGVRQLESWRVILQLVPSLSSGCF